MFLKYFSLFLLTLFIIINKNDSARILAVIPTASYSHQMFYQQLWRQLAIQGHDMVVITTDPTGETLPNFKEISIRESYGPFKKIIDLILEQGMFNIFFSSEMDELGKELIHFQLGLPQVQQIVRNESEYFDLLMVEHMPGPFYALKKRFGCPMIGVVSLDGFPSSHEAMGNPVYSVLYPYSLFPYQENISLWERIIVVVFNGLARVFEQFDGLRMNVYAKDYFGVDVDVMEMLGETDMLFVNANPLFTVVRPHTPATINLAGGIHMKPPRELPKDLKQFLDKGKDGVIYFSLGSNVKSKELSMELRETILTTLSQLPYKVLWKFEDDTLPGKPKNVMITKWAPQQDVLRHPNVKLFITQGGIQSLEEALYSHVPMVVIPFLADQEGNAVKVQSKGLGLTLHPTTLNTNNFKNAILEVLKDPKYKANVKLLAAQIQDQPMTPMEKAIWWIEYVLRHKGAQHLKGPKIPLYQYYYFDVLGALVATVFVIILFIWLSFKGIAKCCRSLTSKDNKIKKD